MQNGEPNRRMQALLADTEFVPYEILAKLSAVMITGYHPQTFYSSQLSKQCGLRRMRGHIL